MAFHYKCVSLINTSYTTLFLISAPATLLLIKKFFIYHVYCVAGPPQKGKRLSKYITLLVPIHLNHPNVCIVCNVHKEMNQKSAIIKREHKTKEVGLFVHKVEALVLKVKCRQILYYERLN